MAAAEPTSRRYAHSEGVTRITFDRDRHLVTCGHDCDVRTFSGIDEDDSSEFTISTETVSAVAPYTLEGRDLVAVAIDNHTVQAFTKDGSPEGLLMRFTRPITFLSVDHTHCRLAASSCDFTIRTVQLDDITQVGCLRGHEAPVLCAIFGPRGALLASSSCDGSIRVWDMKNGNVCVKELSVLKKCNDVSMAPSMAIVSWQPNSGKLLAVPVETEVRVYERDSWELIATLRDSAHKEAINVVSWSGCGQFLASGGVDGVVCVWSFPSRSVTERYCNENGIGITSMEWYPDTRNEESEPDTKRGLYFADNEGYIGWFHGAGPGGRGLSLGAEPTDPLADDSLLMEGIPPDAIFGTDDVIDEVQDGRDLSEPPPSGSHGNTPENDDIIHSRKRRRLLDDSDGEIDVAPGEGDSLISGDVGSAHSRPLAPPTSRSPSAAVFSDKLLEVYQSPLLPSSTPHTLTHHFLTYNMVGVVHSHSDNDTPMIEVEFHNTTVHHSFSLPNHHGNSIASLSESCLALACQRNEGCPSQLQCMNYSCWDSGNKEWTVSLPGKESATGLSLGNGWVTVATDKQLLRVFSLGGMQRDVISVAGVIVGVAGWGSRLAVIYQEPPCTERVFQLKVWMVDVVKRRQLSHPHTLPLSLHSQLEWFGFSEAGCLVTYDSKGIVRLLDSAHYGGSSWTPILDTTKQVGSKSDHYFLVGMTHNPDEIRAILCKGLMFPPVHPRPVMTVLPLQLPLCDISSERTQLEDKYLQELLLRRDGVARAQALMKMFALACKADHNYRALEIAELMEDEMTLNLALTYASRTQHHALARKISDIISNFSRERAEEGGERDVSDVETESDAVYSESRASALRKRVQSGNGPSNGTNISRLVGQNPRTKSSAKSDKRSGKPSDGEFLNSAPLATVVRGDSREDDMTRELFSSGEEEEMGDEGGCEGVSTPLPPTPLTGAKKSNPFKMTTPESRRVQSDRRSSFLDNVGQRTQRQAEQEEREAHRKRQRERGMKVVKTKKQQVGDKKVQRNLKMAPVGSSTRDPASSGKKVGSGKGVKDASSGGERVNPTEGVAEPTKQKLNSFAFKDTT